MNVGRASAGLWVARAGGLGLQAVHFALVARLLAPADFGGWVGAIALLTIAGALAEFGLVQTIVLELERRPAEPDDVAREAVVATAGLTGASLVFAVPLGWLTLPDAGRTALLLLIPWYVVSRVCLPHLAARQHRLNTVRMAAAELSGRAVPVVALAAVWSAAQAWSTDGRLAAIGVSLLAGALTSFAVLRVGAGGTAAPGGAIALVRRAVPLGTTAALSLVHTRVDQLVLSAYGKRLALASYGIAYRVLDAAMALATAAGAATFPALARCDEGERSALARRTCAVLALVGLVTGMAAFVLAPALASVLGGGAYPEAAWLLRLLTPALVVSTVNLGVAQLAVVEGLGGRLVRVAAAGVALNLTLNLLLDGRHGARSAALATVVSEVVGFALVWRLAARARPGCVAPASVLGPLVAFPVAAFGGLAAWQGSGVLAGLAVATGIVVAGVALAWPHAFERRKMEVSV